jgi:hypothetical protein
MEGNCEERHTEKRKENEGMEERIIKRKTRSKALRNMIKDVT